MKIAVADTSVNVLCFSVYSRREPYHSEGKPQPRRRAHVMLGWLVCLLGPANCLLGAKLINDKLGDPAEPYIGAAAALLAAAGLALAFKAYRACCRGGGDGGVRGQEDTKK